MSRQISEERKTAYYVGMGITILGVLSFASVFVSGILHFGDSLPGADFSKSLALRGFGGMGLIILGAAIRNIASRGLAGSGVVLDPEKARDDLEPYTRMVGGMAKDALDEAGIALGDKEPERVIMVKCQTCGKLNQEDAKFCQECGKKL